MPIIDPGAEYRTLLEKQKRPSDISSIKKYYKENELTPRFGEWVGSQTQYNALKNNLNVEVGLEDVKRKTSAISSVVQQAVKLKEAGISITPQTQIAPTKEYASVFPDLAKDIPEGAYRIGETGKPEYYGLPDPGKDEGIWKPVTPQYLEKQPGYVPPKTSPTAPPTAPPLAEPTPNVPTSTLSPNDFQSIQLSNTDIGDIMNEISEGTFTSPELVLSQEEALMATEAEKAKAAQALSQLQQNMAKSGMAFSGIRNSAEEQAAAASLSKLSGINLDLASKIVSAARQEQNRRIQAIQTQQNAQRVSLASMGYTINPLTGTLEKTLAREQFEQKALEPKVQNVGGNLIEYNPNTGEVNMIYRGAPGYKYFEDANGNITEYDPETGDQRNLGRMGKGFKPSSDDSGQPIDYSGKYSMEYLESRINAGQYVSDNGEIDWTAVDYDLENVDKALWNDTTVYLTDYMKSQREIAEQKNSIEEPTPEVKSWFSNLREPLEDFFVENNPMAQSFKWLFGK